MPKIDARTVAEHHDLHYAKLIDAALEFLTDHDMDALTVAALAKRAGRSRASMYAYFGSAEDLRAAVCTQALQRWANDIMATVAGQVPALERLDRFVVAQITSSLGPQIDRALGYIAAQTSTQFRARIDEVLAPLNDELNDIIAALGVTPPARAATMVQGAVAAAADQVRDGADPAEVADDTLAFVRAGITALGTTTSRRGHGRSPHDRSEPGHGGGSLAGANLSSERAESGEAPARGLRRSQAQPVSSSAAPGSFSALLASAVATAAHRPVRGASVRRPRAQAARVAVLPLMWTAVGFASGLTGIGGTGLHLLLGLSLVVMMVWAARLTTPARLVFLGMRALALLAMVAAVIALPGRSHAIDAVVAVHIALAAVLLVGLAMLVASGWKSDGPQLV